MPPRLYKDLELELSPAQQYAYKLAEDEGVVHLKADDAPGRADDGGNERGVVARAGAEMERWLDTWYSPVAQERLRAAVKKLEG